MLLLYRVCANHCSSPLVHYSHPRRVQQRPGPSQEVGLAAVGIAVQPRGIPEDLVAQQGRVDHLLVRPKRRTCQPSHHQVPQRGDFQQMGEVDRNRGVQGTGHVRPRGPADRARR